MIPFVFTEDYDSALCESYYADDQEEPCDHWDDVDGDRGREDEEE